MGAEPTVSGRIKLRYQLSPHKRRAVEHRTVKVPRSSLNPVTAGDRRGWRRRCCCGVAQAAAAASGVTVVPLEESRIESQVESRCSSSVVLGPCLDVMEELDFLPPIVDNGEFIYLESP